MAAALGVSRHVELSVDLSAFGGSALTDAIDVPKDRAARRPATFPSTYVPARNTVFLSLALAWAEVLGARDIFIGVNALDYSGYPDCRPEYIEAFERHGAAGDEGRRRRGRAFRIHAPLIRMTKAEIIRRGHGTRRRLRRSPTAATTPDPDGRPCGHCDSCLLRAKGFAEAGVPDPALT